MRKILNKVSLIIFFILLSSELNAQCPKKLDGVWTVTGFSGELWYAEEKDIINKNQQFFKGSAEGVFYSCDYGGQSYTHNSYTIKEFLKNKEFKDLSKVFAENNFSNNKTEVFVHRITCNGKKISDRRVMYPFVTVCDSDKGFYIYEGAIITLEKIKNY